MKKILVLAPVLAIAGVGETSLQTLAVVGGTFAADRIQALEAAGWRTGPRGPVGRGRPARPTGPRVTG